MRLYWPAPMITAGLAWIFFADSPLIGWALMFVALGGAIRSVRRWLDVTMSDFVSTVLVLPLIVRERWDDGAAPFAIVGG